MRLWRRVRSTNGGASRDSIFAGVVCDNHRVHTVAVTRSGRGRHMRWQLLGRAEAPIPTNAMEGYLVTDIELLSTAVQKTVQSLDVADAKAAIALDDVVVTTEVVSVNRWRPLTTQWAYSLLHRRYPETAYIDYAFDWYRVNRTTAQLVFARRRLVDMRVAAVEVGGLTVKAVEVARLAVFRAVQTLASLAGHDVDGTAALLTIAGTRLALVVKRADGGVEEYVTKRLSPIANYHDTAEAANALLRTVSATTCLIHCDHQQTEAALTVPDNGQLLSVRQLLIDAAMALPLDAVAPLGLALWQR